MNELFTDRLLLRALVIADADDLFTARGDAEVMTHWDGLPDTSAAETRTVTEMSLSEMRTGAAEYWAIRLRSDGSFVGVCDLSDIRAGESADVGFMLAGKYWGLGLGTEVLRRLLLYAGSLGLTRVTARIHSGNVRSRALLLRAGFEIVEEMQQYEVRPNVFRDCIRLQSQLP